MGTTRRRVTPTAAKEILSLTRKGLTTPQVVSRTGYAKSTVNNIKRCGSYTAYRAYTTILVVRFRARRADAPTEPTRRRTSAPVEVQVSKLAAELRALSKRLNDLERPPRRFPFFTRK